jgi:hypothetical protein
LEQPQGSLHIGAAELWVGWFLWCHAVVQPGGEDQGLVSMQEREQVGVGGLVEVLENYFNDSRI